MTGTLDLGGYDNMIASLSGTGVVTNSGITAAALTVGFGGHTPTSTFGGMIEDGAAATALALNGNGTLILTGSNTYSGSTAINQGTLIINGSTLSSGLVSVASGATLGGTGSTGIVTVSGGGNINLQDGKIGTLTVGGLTSGGGTASAFSFDIQTTGTMTTVDQISDSGTLSLGGGKTTINIGALAGTTSLVAGQYELLSYMGTQQSLADLTLSTNELDGFALTLVQTGDTIYLAVGTPTTYDLGASASDPRVISGGTVQVTSTITNTGTGTADGLNYTGLSTTGTPTGGLPTSGGPVAQGGNASGTGTLSVGTTTGFRTITPIVTSATNANLGTAATLGGTTTVTIDVVANRTENATGVDLGRMLVNQTNSGTTTISSVTGEDDLYTRTTLEAGTQTDTITNGSITLNNGTSYTFGGSNDGTNSTTAGITGNFTAAGTQSGTANFTLAGEGLAGEQVNDVSVAYTADAVNKRVITDGATTDLGVLHNGATVNATSNAFTTTGTYDTTTSVEVAAGNGVIDANGIAVTGSATIFDGTNTSDTRTLSGTIINANGGAVQGGFAMGVATLENGGAGLAGEGAYNNVDILYSAFVYTGQGVWNTNGGGSWGAVSATPTNWTADGGTPGLDANFTSTDSATFGNVLNVGPALITLDGDNPSLNAITFNDANYSYILAQGTSGTFTLNGGSGNATITDEAGLQIISAPIALATGVNVNVLANQQLILSGDISGNHGLTFTGAGTTILSGTNSYIGNTTINAGTLAVGSSAALGTGNVINNATLTTSNNNNAIIVNGNYTQGANATLFLNLYSPTTYDALTVTGTGVATLNGTLNLNLVGGFDPGSGQTFTLVKTNETIDGTFSTITTNLASIGLIPDYTNDVTVLYQKSFVDLLGSNLTPNQRAVATYIDAHDLHITNPNFGSLVSALNSVSNDASTLAGAFDQLDSVKFANFASSNAFNNASFFVQQFDNYLANHRSADGTFVGSDGGLDYSGLTVNDSSTDTGLQSVRSRLLAWSPAPGLGLLSDTGDPVLGGVDMKNSDAVLSGPTNLWNVFITGNVVLAQNFSDASAGLPYGSSTTGAVQIGADYKITPHWLAGVTFGYGHTNATLDAFGSNANVNTYSPGVYTSFAKNGWYANALASYGFTTYSQSRDVSIGAFGGTAHSSPDGGQVVADLDGGYDFHSGNWTFGPTLGTQFVHLNVDGYTESGLPGANLTVNQNSSNSFRSLLGGRVSYAVKSGNMIFTPHLSASWQHEFLDQSRGITSQFSDVGAGSFVVNTPNPSRESALIDVGFDAQVNNALTVFTDYSVQAGQSNYFGQSIQAGVKIGF